MSQTDELDITLIDPNQIQKTITMNSALQQISKSLAGELIVAVGSHASPYTLPYDSTESGDKTALEYMCLKFTGVLAADYNVIHPNKRHLLMLLNVTTGGHNVIIKTAAGASVSVDAGWRIIYCDGTDVLDVTPTPGLITLAALFSAADLSGLPASNPGGGKPWLNGGFLCVGAP